MIVPKGVDTEFTFIFFEQVILFIKNSEFANEMEWQNKLEFEDVNIKQFFEEFVWVVLSAGISNAAALSMFQNFKQTFDPTVIAHPSKRAAIIKGLNSQVKWFNEMKSKKTEREVVEYFGTLPWIGKITKYHLAKNLGIDCVKPDRHLVLLAKKFKWDNPRIMCEWLGERFNMKLRVIDVMLWRYCNQHPNVMKGFKQDVLI